VVSLAEDRPRLEKYEVLEEIGHGGMATVYRAHDRRLGRDVALKVIHRHLRESKEVAARFVSEARAVAKLRHRNIVEVYDVSDEGEDERYLIVELVPGTTLRKLLAEHGHMPAEIAAAVALEIAAALEHAHQQGVIHRDVKPENVLIDFSERPPESRDSETEELDRGRVKITDFGIAKLLDAQGVTSTGQVLGSPAHMAPEQIEGGDVTARSDVFGLGVLLYECMVGRLPFDGKNPAQVLRKVLDGTFTPPERARPTVGAGLSKVVCKALARESDDRYASCAELSEALRAELEMLGFPNPRRDLSQYLKDPKVYVEMYEPRVVERLVELGKKARAERTAPLAAAYFNRALAFRPDDAELLRQVAGLAQTERMKRLGGQAAAVVVIAAAVTGIAFAISRATRPTLGIAPDNTVDPKPPVSGFERPKLPPKALSSDPAPDKTKNPKVAVPVNTAEPTFGKTRKVRINVVGARGGATVKVDGNVFSTWFIHPIDLTVGVHQFEFIPKNNMCCKNLGVKSIDIPPGDQEFAVVGNIPINDGTVIFTGPEGATATCPQLFSATLKPGSNASVKMNSESVAKGTCTINGPDGTAKSEQVSVPAGGSTTIRWP
jgi:serine/threonine-protein kinase